MKTIVHTINAKEKIFVTRYLITFLVFYLGVIFFIAFVRRDFIIGK